MLGQTTKQFLEKNDSQVIDLLDDSYKLHEAYKSNFGYEDYTFIVTPAFKALEKWIYVVAPFIGVDESVLEDTKNNQKSVGGLWRDARKIENITDKVLDEIEANEELKDDVKTEVLGLKSFLKNYRHKIAHCWNILEYPNDAFMYLMTIIGGIRRITEKLTEVGVIK